MTRLYDQFGYDTVGNSPLSESWRSGPGQPAWDAAFMHQTRAELAANAWVPVPPPDAFVVAPCTFNTLNKWAAGVSDTLVLGLLNEARSGTPFIGRGGRPRTGGP